MGELMSDDARLVEYARTSDLRNDPLVIDLCAAVERLTQERDAYRSDSAAGQFEHGRWQERADRAEAALARVTEEHCCITLTGLVAMECVEGACEHDEQKECPADVTLDVCEECLRIAREVDSAYGEEGYFEEVFWPCATTRAVASEQTEDGR